ncbi:MAG: hypothetical protein WEB13_07465 [Dehalococcoidia bacterium]
MHFTRARALGLLLTLAVLASASTGCGDGNPDAAIRDTVTRWLDAWVRTSGPARDDVAAAEARRELGGDLLVRTDAAGAAAAGAPRARLLAGVYSAFVGLTIPPDRGFEVLALARDGESARVWVRLRYSEAAAGAAAAAGLIPFDHVARLNVLVTAPPEPVFTVTLVDGEWRITAIRPG